MKNEIEGHYDEIARQYYAFYSSDLYSVKENKAIANFIKASIGDSLKQKSLRIGDFGCGAGMPRVIWKTLFSKNVTYNGYDLSSNMLGVASEVYFKEIKHGKAVFFKGEIPQVLKSIPAKHYDLGFLLHGVLSYILSQNLPETLSEVSRVVRGFAVFSFFSRYAYNRAPDYPREYLHRDRQLNCDPLTVYTYTTDEIKSLLKQAGFEIVAIQGMNIVGGVGSIHEGFVLKQRDLERQRPKGHSMFMAYKKLAAEIERVIQKDMELGKLCPALGHDIIVIARPK